MAADLVLSHSSAVAAEMAQIGVRPDRIHVIHNGVDTRHFQIVQPRETVRAREKWPDGTIIYVVLANLIPYKGHENLLLALKQFI